LGCTGSWCRRRTIIFVRKDGIDSRRAKEYLQGERKARGKFVTYIIIAYNGLLYNGANDIVVD
jgi:hypothetical protein